MAKSQNKNLHKAKQGKNDEFYTQLCDIENELRHYKEHFRGKTVLCNCDDPRISNFFHYFTYNFEHLGLKKLITTCYKNQDMELFSTNNSERAIYLEYEGGKVGNDSTVPLVEDIGIQYLKGDGDFRSAECIELLKQADIVVTNPPFSLFREYVSQLVQHDKKFLIIGNQNAITYKEIFKLIKENKLWLGTDLKHTSRKFQVPQHIIFYTSNQNDCTVDKEGNKFIQLRSTKWFTNLDHNKRYEDLILYKKYTPEEYPHYDNYNAINVDKTKDIPLDWSGAMGVPITFLDKYNPKQFEILGIMNSGEQNEGIRYPNTPHGRPVVNGKEIYFRIIIRNKKI